MANSTIEEEKCKGHEKRDRLLNSKLELNYQISQRSENFIYRSSFLKLYSPYQQSTIHKLSEKFNDM